MKFIYVFPILYFGISWHLFAQGCSDAGFCSMGAMKPDQHFSRKENFRLRSIGIERYWAITKFSNVIQSTTIELNIGVGKKNTLQFKIPYSSSSAAKWRLEGFGDISLSFTRKLIDREKFDINGTLGAKIPTGNANRGLKAGLTLPMYYQVTLGTYDLVAGLSFINKNWLIATGIQQALHANKNQFTWAQWRDHPRRSEILKYSPSKNLRRGTDVMWRIERNFRFSRWNFTAGILSIQRITPDKITSPKSGKRIALAKTKGLAMSILASAKYRLSRRSSIQALFGNKLMQRKTNADGLSREQVVTLSYNHNF